MQFRTGKVLKTFLLPGGFILLGAVLLLRSAIPVPASGVSFFYYAVILVAALLAWRFHSKRILFAVIIVLLGYQAIQWFAHGLTATPGPGRVAFEAVAVLLPLNFAFLTFFTERGDEHHALLWFLALVFFESVFVAVAARPEQPAPAFLHYRFFASYHPRLPQPAMLAFVGCGILLLVRIFRFHRPTDSGFFWALAAVFMAMQAAVPWKGTVYFSVAALALASSIIENSYSLAYHDELTGLNSRRSFNEALFRLRHPYAVAMVDIDHFKSINDTYGHDTGDQVLRLVASKLARVGGGGEAFRVGGEEFTILFPGKNAAGVADYLELLRLNIENSAFRVRSGEERRKAPRTQERRAPSKRRFTVGARPTKLLSVTVSIGFAESRLKANIHGIIEHADRALYRAKNSGRNRIELASDEPELRPRKGKKKVRV